MQVLNRSVSFCTQKPLYYAVVVENYNNKEFSIAKSCIFRYNKKGCCRNRQQIMNRT